MQGWRLAGIASAALVASQAALFAWAGTDEAGLRAVVRVSARISFALFLLPYLAAPARQLWPAPATRWLLRNRRYLGVSFAVAHFLHLFDIVLLALLLGDAFETELVTLVGGGAAYALLAAMTATSFDRSARWLSPRRWKLLHRTGLYWLWFIFALQWTVLAFQSPAYLLLALAVWAALGVRIAAWRARRGATSSAAATVRAG